MNPKTYAEGKLGPQGAVVETRRRRLDKRRSTCARGQKVSGLVEQRDNVVQAWAGFGQQVYFDEKCRQEAYDNATVLCV